MLNLTGMIPANVPDRPRKKKSTSAQHQAVSLEESVDVKLTRALAGVYANTDLACRFVAAEIRGYAITKVKELSQ